MPRTIGAKGKPKQTLLRLLQQQWPGYQPVVEIAKAAHELTAQAMASESPELWRDAGAMHDKVAQYVTPKLKAIELTGEDGGPIRTESKMLEVVGVKAEVKDDKEV